MSVVTHTGQTHLGANTKFFISDLVQPSENYFTGSLSSGVKLRMQEKGLGAEVAVSIPTLLQVSYGEIIPAGCQASYSLPVLQQLPPLAYHSAVFVFKDNQSSRNTNNESHLRVQRTPGYQDDILINRKRGRLANLFRKRYHNKKN